MPAFRPDGYRNAPRSLALLRELGFRWVTLHPTYPVYDEIPLRIDTDSAPDVAEALAAAHEYGLQVRIEPHLDWAPTLSGGTYEWRRRMYVAPDELYFEHILAPLAELRPEELTLGSELDVSAYEFAERWSGVAGRLRHFCRVGHKVNHDAFGAGRAAIRAELNIERERRGLGRRSRWRFGQKLFEYLDSLDYVAISFYPPGEWIFPEGYTIGEFGLGSTDTNKPWHFDASKFQTPDDFEIRRTWYQQFLHWLPSSGAAGAASFWTAGHFDVLGIMHPEWRDEEVLAAVVAYNQAASP